MRYALERACTCTKAQRNYECAGKPPVFHEVDEGDDPQALLAEGCRLAREIGVEYRVTEKAHGEVYARCMVPGNVRGTV